MKKSAKGFLVFGLVLFAAFITAYQSEACSVFRVTAKDGTIISGRSMEFGNDLKYAMIVVPRNKEFISPAPTGGQGLVWKTKYGYVANNVLGVESVISDGMNEAGLAFSALWYEPDTQFQSVGPGDQKAVLAHMMVGSWLLGNFSTVDEAAAGLKKIRLYAMKIPQMGMAPPAHVILYDAKGGCIVVEYERGELKIYDDPLGIMTNAPNFPWMMSNLRNYVGMTNEEWGTQDFSGVKITPTGHGNGMFGLPGDITPPSRFVRMAIMTKFADQQENAQKTLNLAQHIISSLDIVKGMVVDKAPDGRITSSETTQWATFRDLTNKVFYFRTYDNCNLRKIDLKLLDFNAGKTKTIPMYGDDEIITDVTTLGK